MQSYKCIQVLNSSSLYLSSHVCPTSHSCGIMLLASSTVTCGCISKHRSCSFGVTDAAIFSIPHALRWPQRSQDINCTLQLHSADKTMFLSDEGGQRRNHISARCSQRTSFPPISLLQMLSLFLLDPWQYFHPRHAKSLSRVDGQFQISLPAAL
jgi:hypothetical protein